MEFHNSDIWPGAQAVVLEILSARTYVPDASDSFQADIKDHNTACYGDIFTAGGNILLKKYI